MTGPSLFRRFLKKHEVTQLAASKALGVSDPTIHDWVHGIKRPRAHHREAIAVWTGDRVPVASWLLDEERHAVAEVRPFLAGASESEQSVSSVRPIISAGSADAIAHERGGE